MGAQGHGMSVYGVDLDPIVTNRFPLDQYEDAFALMDDRRGIVARIVLEHDV